MDRIHPLGELAKNSFLFAGTRYARDFFHEFSRRVDRIPFASFEILVRRRETLRPGRQESCFARMSCALPRSPAMNPVVPKIPMPTMFDTTSAVALTNPSCRRSPTLP